jgi:hypothetical protein
MTNDQQGGFMNTARTPGTLRATVMRRIAQLIAALAILTGLSVATEGTAMATNVGEQACNYGSQYNACLLITNLGSNMYRVHVGIDIYMSQQDAQNLIGAGSVPVVGLYGDDGSSTANDFLTSGFSIAEPPVAWAQGWSAGFTIDVNGSLLNEDDGIDEIIATMRLYITGYAYLHVALEDTYYTSQVVSAF